MPKVTLKFNLPEEEEQFKEACQPWKRVVQELDRSLRHKVKYEDLTGSYDAARDLLYEVLNDMGLEDEF